MKKIVAAFLILVASATLQDHSRSALAVEYGFVDSIIGGGAGEDVPATTGILLRPEGIAVDANGDVYISDSRTCRVRLVHEGVVRTVAGNGRCESSGDGGPATSAGLRQPWGLTLSETGELYIGELCGLRKVDNSGVISRLAGNGDCTYSGDGLNALQTGVGFISSLALDESGDLYFAEPYNCIVRVLTGGKLSTLAGNGVCGYAGDGGAATAAQLHEPLDISIDSTGRVLIADHRNQAIRAVHDGLISTFGTPGSVKSLGIDDADNLYYSVGELCTVRKVTPDGSTETIAGTGTCHPWAPDGPALATALIHISVVEPAPDGSVFIATADCRVRQLLAGYLAIFAGRAAGICTSFYGDGVLAEHASISGDVQGLAVGLNDEVYFSDTTNCAVRMIANGVVTTVAGDGDCVGPTGDGGDARLATVHQPKGLAVDPLGNLYIAEWAAGRVRRVTDGIITTFASNLYNPVGVASDAAGNIYIAERDMRRITKVSNGQSTLLASGSVNPTAIAASPNGDLYILDVDYTTGCRLVRIRGRTLTALTGTFCNTGGPDGSLAIHALISWPNAIASDRFGNVYIGESTCVIRRIVADRIYTVAGSMLCGYSSDGVPANEARIGATSMAMNSQGDLIVGDFHTGRVRVIGGVAADMDLDGLPDDHESIVGTSPTENDSDRDGCSDGEEVQSDPSLGGQRDPLDSWDFFDVTADSTVGMSDALDVLSFFGDPGLPGTEGDIRDRDEGPAELSWQTSESDDGVDLIDALASLKSFGHSCAGPP